MAVGRQDVELLLRACRSTTTSTMTSFTRPDPELLQPFLEAGRITEHDIEMFDEGRASSRPLASVRPEAYMLLCFPVRYLRWDMRV